MVVAAAATRATRPKLLFGYPPHSSRVLRRPQSLVCPVRAERRSTADRASPSRRHVDSPALRRAAAGDGPAGVAGIDRQPAVVPVEVLRLRDQGRRAARALPNRQRPPVYVVALTDRVDAAAFTRDCLLEARVLGTLRESRGDRLHGRLAFVCRP
jgi:hypothetical protein